VVLGVEVFGSNLDDEGEAEEVVNGGDYVSTSLDCEAAVLMSISVSELHSYVGWKYQNLLVGRSPLEGRQSQELV
jgi:hypothetical protein